MERDEEMYGQGTNARLPSHPDQTDRNRTPSFTAIPDFPSPTSQCALRTHSLIRLLHPGGISIALKLDNVYALSVTLHSSINDSPSSRSEKQVANHTHEIGHVQRDPILTAST